ncbi:hypothetical protein NMG60_11020394 [Bertholletia excelsa]
MEEPGRSAIIDSCIRVTDNGRESYFRKVFFNFTLYNTSNHNDQVKFGASSPEEAARWIHSLQEAAQSPTKNFLAFPSRKWQRLKMSFSKRNSCSNSVDWTSTSSMYMNAMTSDVIDPSPWKIFGCENGLRLFKEANDSDIRMKSQYWDSHPAIMAVGIIDGTSESVFRTVMSLGPSRSEWDFCYHRACIIEHLDGHTDIVHMKLSSDWLPWGLKRRDLVFQRYWRREDDGTYVILFHSVIHQKCPPQDGYIRAILKSGGYVITPVNQGKESVVKHMLAVNWKCLRSFLQKSSSRSLTVHMLGRIAALRELFKTKAGYCSSEFSYFGSAKDFGLTQTEREDGNVEGKNSEMVMDVKVDKKEDKPAGSSSLLELDDADDDEFFDVPEPLDDDQLENDWPSGLSPDMHCPDTYHPQPSSATSFVKKFHNLAIQKKGYMDLQEKALEENMFCFYGSTLRKDPTCGMPCTWTTADPSTFLIRGESYLQDRRKIKAKGTLMQLVAADWIKSDKREDDLGSRRGGIVQKYAALGGPEFFFIVNLQIPGSSMLSLAFYFMTKTPLEKIPLLERFVHGDDSYRNSRFKLIPYISKGSWIVKQSVGKKACLLGRAIEINYHQGSNYLELGVDVGSSTVARGVSNLVQGYFNNLVAELAFLIQANTQDELPETLLGTCRVNQLDVSKAVAATP